MVSTPMSVSADIGPKPSVEIEFIGLEEEEYYVTLLSEIDSTGPWSEGNSYYEYMGDEAVFKKFSEYEDADGYYFLSYMEDCSEDDVFEWNYYPPQKFKVLIYLPEKDSFIATGQIYERYAFDSYFTVYVSDVEASKIEAEESYDFSMEIVSLIARVILTVVAELLIALLFCYRDKKSLTAIALANVVTQVILNILLNVINYNSGQYAFVFHYVWMEIVVFIIEAFIYDKAIGRENKATGKKYHPWAYAAVANLISIIVGIWIARVIPGIF
ncbi:MAG: hypothetical protein IJ326_11980 [Lachnospiraceae bacterium]|nr:hypothetical protein [Lachnospiraceae bacterium]